MRYSTTKKRTLQHNVRRQQERAEGYQSPLVRTINGLLYFFSAMHFIANEWNEGTTSTPPPVTCGFASARLSSWSTSRQQMLEHTLFVHKCGEPIDLLWPTPSRLTITCISFTRSIASSASPPAQFCFTLIVMWTWKVISGIGRSNERTLYDSYKLIYMHLKPINPMPSYH